MNWFLNLKIANKLIVAFLCVAVIAALVGAVGVLNLSNLAERDTELYEKYAVPMGQMGDMREAYQKGRVNIRDAILSKDTRVQTEKMEKFNDSIRAMKVASTEIGKTLVSDEGRKLHKTIDDGISQYELYSKKLFPLFQAGQVDQVNQLMQTEGIRLADTIGDTLDQLSAMKIELAKQKAVNNKADASRATMIMITIVVAGVAIAMALGLYIAQVISRPVKELAAAADKLAVGDVNVNVTATTGDEIGMLMQSFAKMVSSIRDQAFVVEKIASGDMTVEVTVRSGNDLLGKKLREMVATNNQILSDINHSAEQVAAGAQQIAASGEALSQGSTEQASAIEEITASMTQVATQTTQNAVNANQANELSVSAKEQAIEGNSQMQEMVKAMTEINESSANISKIIKVIDEIAFQTNILALNAAVEAARAGQHGKGFAVVAEEVRNLAARSASAAKETTVMIEGSIKKVDIGTRIANDTAKALSGIVEGVAKATNLVGAIAEASNEQATAISQINQAIVQVSQVVQTNSATAEESASASEELSAQAMALQDDVSKFKLKKNQPRFQDAEGLSPDILRVIQDMIDKKKQEPGSIPKAKIVLDDNEFGKY